MRKALLILLLVLLAVGISGCLNTNTDNSTTNNSTTDNSTTDNSTTDNSTTDGPNDGLEEPPENADSNNNSSSGNNTENVTLPPFVASIVTADPIPSDFEYLGATAVKSNMANFGISGVLTGYRGMYNYEGNNLFLAVFTCNETTQSAETYLQQMKESHADQFGKNSEIQTIQIKGQNVTLMAANVQELPTTGRYILAWTRTSYWDDADYLIIVYGQTDLDALKTLAEASKL